MQHLSLDCLRKLIVEGAFMPPRSEGSPELSGTTAILLVFQADSQHKEITDVYVGLICRVKSHCNNTTKSFNFLVTQISLYCSLVLQVSQSQLEHSSSQPGPWPSGPFSSSQPGPWPSGPFSSSQPGPWPSGPFSSSPLLDASSSAPWSGVSDLLKLTALYTISEFN